MVLSAQRKTAWKQAENRGLLGVEEIFIPPVSTTYPDTSLIGVLPNITFQIVTFIQQKGSKMSAEV